MPATRAAMGARGAPARRAVLKARAADMVGREEMDCGMGELAELAFVGVEGCDEHDFSRAGQTSCFGRRPSTRPQLCCRCILHHQFSLNGVVSIAAVHLYSEIFSTSELYCTCSLLIYNTMGSPMHSHLHISARLDRLSQCEPW
jgi:hypothetical protein